jgi:hypothetical protein
LPPSNFVTVIRITKAHLQRRDSSSLLESGSDVVKYIHKLTYKLSHVNDDRLLSPILLKNFLPTISCLNCLTIRVTGSLKKWNKLDSSLTSALLRLMHLPTINHINLIDRQFSTVYSHSIYQPASA